MTLFSCQDRPEGFFVADLYAALTEVVAEKSFLASDWSYLRGRLEELYCFSIGPTRLTSPFPEVCAYRLAHVMMRDARDKADFIRILELLQEPCRLSAFGARPHLLRVAALHRLRLIDPETVTDTDIQQGFNNALELARRPLEETDIKAVTQRVTANLIEQTGYLLGLPFAGSIDPDFVSSAVPKGDWVVLVRGIPMIWMTEPLARIFYEESIKRLQPTIRFEWQSYPSVKFLGGNLTRKDAILAATLCLAEHDDDALWRAMDVKREESVGDQLGPRFVRHQRPWNSLA